MNFEEYKTAVEQLNLWTKFYDEGTPLVSDKEWDQLYFKIWQFEKEHPDQILDVSPTQIISYDVVFELNKVKHNHPMLSLAKTKEIEEFG